MGKRVRRGRISPKNRLPDVFISHSRNDASTARCLALDLAICGVDAWYDQWEIQLGDELHNVIPEAISKSSMVGVVVTENFGISPWTRGELNQALAHEKTTAGKRIVPLIFEEHILPQLVDRANIDMRGPEYYRGLFRLVAEIKGLSLDMISASMVLVPTTSGVSRMISVLMALDRCRVPLRVLVNEQDYQFLESLPKSRCLMDGAVTLDLANLPDLESLSPTLNELIARLPENWRADVARLIDFEPK